MWDINDVTVKWGHNYINLSYNYLVITQRVSFRNQAFNIEFTCPNCNCNHILLGVGKNLSLNQQNGSMAIETYPVSCYATILITLEWQSPTRHYHGYTINTGTPPMSRRRTNYGCSLEAELLYQEAMDSYKVSFTYDEEVVTFIKTTIPSHERSWDADIKSWFIHEKWYDLIKLLLDGKGYNTKTYTKQEDIDMKKKIEDATKQQAHSISISKYPSEKEILDKFGEILKEIGLGNTVFTVKDHKYDKSEWLKVYRKAALALHPDRNPTKSHLMTELNVTWDNMKKVIFKEESQCQTSL